MLGAEHPSTCGSRHQIALCLRKRGDPSGAAAMLREVLDVSTRVMGPVFLAMRER